MFEVRTDLAVEENERITKAQEEAKGITVTEEDFEEEQIHITTVRITTENGAKQTEGSWITKSRGFRKYRKKEQYTFC